MEPSSCRESQDETKEPKAESESEILKIRVEASVFVVDKALLVEHCEYFRALFQSGMRECEQEEIHVRGVSTSGFLIMLGVVSGERPMLDGDQLVEAIECAAFLQVGLLAKHLVDLINSDNCLLVYHAAAEYGLWDLYQTAALFIRDIYSDLEDDLQYLPEELVKHVESLSSQVFVAVGTHSCCPAGELSHAGTRTICYLDEEKNEWKVLTDLPNEASTSLAGLTMLDNKLYILGGVNGLQKQVVDSGFCYDPLQDAWSMFPSPQQLRYNLTLVGHENHLYVIGGEYDRRTMSSVETFAISTGSWSFASHLPRPAAGAACTKAMNRIFISLWKPMETTDIYEFQPSQDKWRLLTTMIRHQSYGHYMVSHRDNLYIMRNGPSDDFLRCHIDCYNLTLGQWSSLPGHYTNSKGALFTAVVRGDSAFTVNRALTLEYTIKDNKWKPKKEMKGFPRSGSVFTFLMRRREAHRHCNEGLHFC